MTQVAAIFVYGTLKHDQLRGGMWPHKPQKISPAVTHATVIDLGPYPAALSGEGWLLGELWEFRRMDMEKTCQVLDRIEGYEALGQNNEYVRCEVNVWCLGEDRQQIEKDTPIPAWMYFCARPEHWQHARRIAPWVRVGEETVASWPDPYSRVPASFGEE